MSFDLACGDILLYCGDGWQDRIIEAATQSEFSHCEVALSASESVGALGRGIVRHTLPAPYAVARTGHLLQPQLRECATSWLLRQVGRQYNYLAIFSDFLGLLTHWRTPMLVAPSRYDCSQLATMFLTHAGYADLPDALADYPSRVSPGDLAKALHPLVTLW